MKRPWQSRKDQWIDNFWVAVMVFMLVLGGSAVILKLWVLLHFVKKYW